MKGYGKAQQKSMKEFKELFERVDDILNLLTEEQRKKIVELIRNPIQNN